MPTISVILIIFSSYVGCALHTLVYLFMKAGRRRKRQLGNGALRQFVLCCRTYGCFLLFCFFSYKIMFTVRFYWNSSEYRQIFIVAVVCGDIMSLHSSTLCWLIIFFIQLSHMFLAGFFLIDFLSSQAISLSFSSFSHKGRYPTPIWETPSCVTVRGFLSGIFVLAEWQSTVHLQTWVKFFQSNSQDSPSSLKYMCIWNFSLCLKCQIIQYSSYFDCVICSISSWKYFFRIANKARV